MEMLSWSVTVGILDIKSKYSSSKHKIVQMRQMAWDVRHRLCSVDFLQEESTAYYNKYIGRM